jgi:catechol 2,3-dioxygenase-like lactoylglutathione lyase family enzyme
MARCSYLAFIVFGTTRIHDHAPHETPFHSATKLLHMLDHITLTVSDFAKAQAFYERALAPLGYTRLMGEENVYWGFGKERPFFWIGAPDETHAVSKAVHVALAAGGKSEVDGFYNAALSAGARDNGAPGYRREYGAGYYAAFVFDLDGNNVEAVFHDPNPLPSGSPEGPE